MKFDSVSMTEIQHYFPDLKVVAGEICGEIEFFAKYVQNHRGQWVIESCKSQEGNCVYGSYKIKIAFDRFGFPSIFETGGKIESLAHKLDKKLIEFHINADGSCCLDFFLNISQKLTLGEFILNKVYPFFVWQAYYAKFEVVPSIGEYSHGKEAMLEFIKDIKKLERNDLCICGSRKKFKNCCSSRFYG